MMHPANPESAAAKGKNMRITCEIGADDLKQIQRITGHKKKAQAIRDALAKFLRMHERREFIEKVLAGRTDYAMTNDELEGLASESRKSRRYG
jgi:hypothetical protein